MEGNKCSTPNPAPLAEDPYQGQFRAGYGIVDITPSERYAVWVSQFVPPFRTAVAYRPYHAPLAKRQCPPLAFLNVRRLAPLFWS